MWCPTQARPPLARQNVLFSSAPHASSGRCAAAQLDARRHQSARAAQHERPAQHRVVGARLDRAVVDEEAVGDRGQALQRLGVVEGDRLVGDVAAGHHERHAGVREQQVVQRRRRQHHAEVGLARRDGGRDRGARAPARDHDRALAPAQQPLLLRPEQDQRACGVEVGRHQGERLVLPVLARAQRGDGVLVVGAAREVVAADALDGDDEAVEQRGGSRRDRVDSAGYGAASRDRIDATSRCDARAAARDGAALAVEQPRARPALRAGVRLGVEAAVERVLVLRPAGRAEREAGHRRARAVVGDAAHDREARAAVGAVDERVAEAAVARVAQLGQAGVARRACRARPARRPDRRPCSRRSRTRARPGTRATGCAPARPAASGGASRGSRARKRSTAAGAPSTSSTTPRSSLRTQPPSRSSRASR